MYIVFKDLKEWYKKDPLLKEKFEDTFDKIFFAAKEYEDSLNRKLKEKLDEPIDLAISELLLKQSLIDAFDDLMRLKNYHITNDPSPIKEMSYIVYWILRHKPLVLRNEDLIKNKKINEIGRVRLLFINESFCVRLLMAAAFPSKIEKDGCQECIEEGRKQIKYLKKFLLYYLVYRLKSPKSLEAILVGTTIYPILEVDPVIWENPKDPGDDF